MPADIFRFNTQAIGFIDTFRGGAYTAAAVDAWLISMDTYNNPAGAKTYKYDLMNASPPANAGHRDANRSGAATTAISNLNAKGYVRTGTYT
jgi:hypothetical protein